MIRILSLFVFALGIGYLLHSFHKHSSYNREPTPHPLPEILQLEFQKNNKFIKLENVEKDALKLIYFGTVYGSEFTPIAFSLFTKVSKERFLKPVHTLFFSLDPSRDHENLVRETIQLYGGRIDFLKGSFENTQYLAKAFQFPYKYEFLSNSNLQYTIDMKPWFYLTTSDFRILGAYPIQIRPERLIMEIQAHIKNLK